MTFSIIGRCGRTGAVGIASATGGIAVGARVAFVAYGIGAVLTQHRTDPRLGPRGIALLRSGCDATRTIAALAASIPDAEARWRQLAVMDNAGASAFFHGAAVKPARGAVQVPDAIALGNVLAGEQVLAAMADAFAAGSDRTLGERLIAALEAGLAGGGEGGPLVSACLKVAAEPGFARIDLRIDRDPEPIAALRRLHDFYAPHADEYARRALDPEAAEGAAAESAMKKALASPAA